MTFFGDQSIDRIGLSAAAKFFSNVDWTVQFGVRPLATFGQGKGCFVSRSDRSDSQKSFALLMTVRKLLLLQGPPSPDSSASSIDTLFQAKSSKPPSSLLVAALGAWHHPSFLAALGHWRQGQDHLRPPSSYAKWCRQSCKRKWSSGNDSVSKFLISLSPSLCLSLCLSLSLFLSFGFRSLNTLKVQLHDCKHGQNPFWGASPGSTKRG